MVEREVSITFFHFWFFDIKSAELFLISIKNCRTIKGATGTIISFINL